jgi:hypothetical protein
MTFLSTLIQDDFNNHVKESGNIQVDKQQVWVQLTRGQKRGRYNGLPGIIDKDRVNHSLTLALTNEHNHCTHNIKYKILLARL